MEQAGPPSTPSQAWMLRLSGGREFGPGAAALLFVAALLGGVLFEFILRVSRDTHRYGGRGLHYDQRHYYHHDRQYDRYGHHHGPGRRCGWYR